MSISFLIVFWAPGSGRLNPPRSPKMSKSGVSQINEFDLNNLKKKLTSSNKDIHNGYVRTLLEEFSKCIFDSKNQYRIGNIFLTVAEAAVNSLVNAPGKDVPIVHYNSSNNSLDNTQTEYFKTVVRIGKSYNSKIKAYLNGPTYEKFTKKICNTKEDYLETVYKKQLMSSSGVNQRNYTFLDCDCFLSIGDVLNFINYDEEVYPKLDTMYKGLIEIIKQNATNTTKVDETVETLLKMGNRMKARALKRPEEANVNNKMIRHFAAILNQKLNLKIYSRIPVYDTHAIIRLVRFKNVDSKESPNLDTLLQNLIWEENYKFNQNWGEKIHAKSIKKQIEPKLDARFSKQLHTTLDVDLAHLESFTNACEIVKTWYRRMPAGATWDFEIKERFKNGIYLNKIYELIGKDNKNNFLDTPVSYFIMIEFYGDNRASVRRNSDGETFESIYSPIEIGYDFQFQIEHLAHTSSQDEILNYEKTTKLKEFDDLKLGLQYYPRRQERLNIDDTNVKIGDKNPDGQFTLLFTKSILENQQLSILEELQKNLSGDKKAFRINEDDIPYMDNSTLNEDEDTSENKEKTD